MDTDRRRFLTGAAAAAAPVFVPRSSWGANDRVAVGFIGTGGRGMYLMERFVKLGAQAAAVCDVYEPHLEAARKLCPEAKAYVDYHELLTQPGIDAVVLAGPDHHHAPMLLAALEARKDVYAEKPLARTLEEGQKMAQAVAKSDRVVQLGMQRRSAPVMQRAYKLVKDGALGRITLVKPQWHWNVAKPLNNSPLEGRLDWKRFLGSAPHRTEPMRYRYWRQFWDYAGGNMTDQGTHLMDVVLWFTGAGAPLSAVCQGYVAKNLGAEHPDVFSAVFEFPEFLATWTLDYCNGYENGWSITFMGDRGTLVLAEEGYALYSEPWKPGVAPSAVERLGVPVEPHIQNFLDCVRSRQQPNCTVEMAQRAVAGPHLANLALQAGRKMRLGADLVSVS